MTATADVLLLLALGLAVYVVATGRLGSAVKASALQGAALALYPLALLESAAPGVLLRAGLVAAGTLAIKAVIIPRLLLGAIRATGARREVEPYVSLHAALLAGLVLVALSFRLGSALVLPNAPASPLPVPVGFSLVMLGFLLLVNRRKAIGQAVGFLVLENGVFVFGQCLAREIPVAVEVGVLLDLVMAIFVMGIVVHRIGRAFDDTDADALTLLKD